MSDSTDYVSLDNLGHRSSSDELASPKVELEQHEQISCKRSWWSTFIIQLACLAWVGPMTYLLYINFTKERIGASAWCPEHKCRVDWFDSKTATPERRLARYDHWSHNLLGVLQLVAKALEVWFALIASALVYLITFLIAGKKEGMPVGYLTRPSEFSEIPGLFDPLLWRTLRPLPGAGKSGKRLQRRIYLFVAFTVFLCGICNLMGPAAAVLAIPSLQWIDSGWVGNSTFVHHNGDSIPGLGNGEDNGDLEVNFFWLSTPCLSEEVMAGNFSCAADPLASELDSWMSTYLTASKLYTDDLRGMSQQDTVRFVLNITHPDNKTIRYSYDVDDVHWVPNRQVLSSLSQDRDIMEYMSQGYNATGINETLYLPLEEVETYTEYNSSLQLLMQRYGPIFGTIANMWSGYNAEDTSMTVVDPDRSIKCYSYYDFFNTPLVEGTTFGNYTKCIRIGRGWDPKNNSTGFSVYQELDSSVSASSPAIDVKIISSDKAVFLANGTLPEWLPEDCLANGQAPDGGRCDYERLFSINEGSRLEDRTANVNTIEYTITAANGTTNATLAVDFVAFLAFTTYTFDPSPITNPLYISELQALPTTWDSISLNPAWLLAAWTVDAGGALYADRTSTITLVNELNLLLEDSKGLNGRYEWDIDYVSLIPIIQTLSILDYTTEQATSTDPRKQKPGQTLLQRNARLYIWAFGLSSRTSRMGAAVAIAGVAVVLVQFVLGFIDRRRYRSPTQLLVAALEHAPADEFKDFIQDHDETKMAKVPFHVRETYQHAGNFTFHRTSW